MLGKRRKKLKHSSNGILCILGTLLILGLNSCITQQDLVYVQSPDWSVDTVVNVRNVASEYLIKSRDVLFIRVKDQQESLTRHLNVEPEQLINGFNEIGLFVNGYTVSAEGNIHLPEVGALKVGGLTLTQTRDLIEKEVRKTLPLATVLVNLVGFKVAILGEVTNPGYYPVYNQNLSIWEAIAMAGDLRDLANRKEVMLVRSVEGGNKVIHLDLTQSDLFQSQYYYLEPYDVLYIKPLKVKQKRSNLSNLGLFSVGLGAISTAISFILLLRS